MKLVIAPEPAPWLGPLLESFDTKDVLVIAPWALPDVFARLLPKRTLAHVRHVSLPGWALVRPLLRRLASQELALSIALRRLTDRLVSRWLPPEVTHVFAPSLTAVRTFAACSVKTERVLLQDQPVLRQLHADLDEAADAVPGAPFLRNYRAEQHVVVQQEEEFVLATRILVTSRYARQSLRRRGAPSEKVAPAPRGERVGLVGELAHDPSSTHVLLAGTTASRGGLEVALAAIEHTQLTLWARRGPGSSEKSLRHPQLRFVNEGSPLPPLRAVVAPAWVEMNTPEVDAAVRCNIPLFATERALGWHEQGRNITIVSASSFTLPNALHSRSLASTLA